MVDVMKVIKGVMVRPGEVVCGVGRPAPIEPEVPVLGDWWWHSCVPNLPEETTMEEFKAMMKLKGLVVIRQDMADDPKVDPNCLELHIEDWVPTCPFVEGVGGFLLVLGDDEDGPFAIWGMSDAGGQRYCERCKDIYSPLTRTHLPHLCWDCVTIPDLYKGGKV